MSTATVTSSFAAVIPAHRRLLMLLRREMWEHRGSLLWTPLIVGGSTALLMLLGVVLIEININNQPVRLDSIVFNGVSLEMLLNPGSYADARLLQGMRAGANQSLLIATTPVFITLAFTVFFYCLGALYDDRRDRSVLFWTSLPVPETDTVLSKLLTATVLAPAVAVLVAIAVMGACLLAQALLVLRLGGQPLPLLWLISNPFRLALTQLTAIPVYALWALPAVGWLLMCSAFARSKPFLWAVMLPVLLGLFVGALNQMGLIDFNLWAAWRDVILRPFAHLFPIILTWLELPAGVRWENALIDPGHLWRSLAQAQVWIGAVTGAAMIAAAIALRRWREAE